MGEIRFRCPNCICLIAVPEQMAGREIYCRYCNRKLTVPAQSQPERKTEREDRLYKVDDRPLDVRERSISFYTPEYRCKICGTCIPVTSEEIGVKKFCPDCDTPFSVTQEWYEEMRLMRREEQKRSWTDPAIRLHPQRYPEKDQPQEIYGVSPVSASKASELIRWPESKKVTVSVPCSVCGAILYVDKDQIGMRVRCPNCAAPFSVTRRWFISERRRRREQEEKRKRSESPSPTAPAAPPCRKHDSAPGVSPAAVSFPSAPLPPKSPGTPPARREILPFNCPLCGGLIYAGKARIGAKIQCPDCGTHFPLTQKLYDLTKRRYEARQERLRYGGAPSPPPASAAILPAAGQAPPRTENRTAETVPPRPPKKLIPVLCGLCGTLLYAEESQVGQQIRCPDCETYTMVTRPLDSAGLPEPELGGGYGLAEPPRPPVIPEPDSQSGGHNKTDPANRPNR